MLRGNKGFFLAEMLVSLSALAVSAVFLIPAISFLWKEEEEVWLEKAERQILFSELLKYAGEGIAPSESVEVENGITFRVFLNTRMDGSREVCVDNDHPSAKKNSVCARLE